MKQTNNTAQEIFDALLALGYDRKSISEYACDGEALAKDRITDQEVAEELFDIATRVH